ncbi:ABC transporter permease [Caldisericum exile]|uniref:ABC transporter permease protein n=1 Tax=Caldisericum exile (strain DSM 21853 / NBRC 104410 / AZM16c01) TaxID=511051 RepID=A0A7U6GER6_CALEA|nr:ABC transporter permease [Caldisericum exile]BAL81026.1 ABC transporter permease protein [Caldisericum exile AZM16c01]
MHISIEKRGYVSKNFSTAIYISSIFFAVIVSSFIFLFRGVNPFYAFYKIFQGSFGSLYGIKETITKAIPLLLIAEGLIVAFKGKFWNIGANGQLLIGATLSTWVALNFGPTNSTIPTLLLMFLVGFIGGALYGLIPALMKVKLGINEIIITLMFNYIAEDFVEYLVYGPWKGKTQYGFPYTDNFPSSATLAQIPGTRISYVTLIVALISAILIYFFIEKTKYGFEIKVTGENPHAAKYSGINFVKITIIMMLISGGLAGIAGVGEVAGIHKHLTYPSQVSSGYGYTAIIVAWLAQLNPILAIISAFFFGGILVGGDIIQTSLGFPFSTINAFNGFILIFVMVGNFFTEYKIKIRR